MRGKSVLEAFLLLLFLRLLLLLEVSRNSLLLAASKPAGEEVEDAKVKPGF